MLRAPYVVGDFAGALFSAVITFFKAVLSAASFSLTLGCKEAYAKPSIELCWDGSTASDFLNISDKSSILVVAG